MQATKPIRDRHGRGFRTLRLSLTPDCNLACVYCVADEFAAVPDRSRSGWMEPEEYADRVRRIMTHAPLDTVRLTGGEPLLYEKTGRLIALLKQAGVARVTLTTNATLLEKRLAELTAAGLDAVNVSLDTLDPATFRRIARRPGLERVLAGIEAARRELPLKLNMTLYRGLNENEIMDLYRFAGERGLVLRYLELMNMGPLFRREGIVEEIVSQAEVLRTIEAGAGPLTALERSASATANYWRAPDGQVFGIIANHSAPFCGDCDRLRMDSRGLLYGCLSVNEGIDPGPQDAGRDREFLQKALAQKQDLRFTGSHLSMKAIGG